MLVTTKDQSTEAFAYGIAGGIMGAAVGAPVGAATEFYNQRQILKDKDDVFVGRAKEKAAQEIERLDKKYKTEDAKKFTKDRINKNLEEFEKFAKGGKYDFKGIAKSAGKQAGAWALFAGAVLFTVDAFKNVGKNAVDYTAKTFNKNREPQQIIIKASCNKQHVDNIERDEEIDD